MKIAILPGDGIGPEIVAEAVRVLDVLRRGGLASETDTAPIGGAVPSPLPERSAEPPVVVIAAPRGAVVAPGEVSRAASSMVLSRALAPGMMQRRWGRMVYISSIMALASTLLPARTAHRALHLHCSARGRCWKDPLT